MAVHRPAQKPVPARTMVKNLSLCPNSPAPLQPVATTASEAFLQRPLTHKEKEIRPVTYPLQFHRSAMNLRSSLSMTLQMIALLQKLRCHWFLVKLPCACWQRRASGSTLDGNICGAPLGNLSHSCRFPSCNQSRLADLLRSPAHHRAAPQA